MVETVTTGSVINGRYKIEKQLGQGGAGVVYKATDAQLARTVAIKVLNVEANMAADKLARFRSEARSVARLNHPNIVTLFDYSEEQGQPYLVMEYVPGQDLWALDNSFSPNLMPTEKVLTIVDDILAALEYSHQKSVIHRDLKPENVMVTPDGQVRVMDFGLARIEGQSRLTQQGLVAGTASYLAPELALGEPGDHRVDLYALGVIMYELLTGRRPFIDDDPLTIISQHIHAPIVPPQHYNSAISDKLQQIILRLLAKRPTERYTNATEVREALAEVTLQLRGGVTHELTQQYTVPKTTTSSPAITHRDLLDRIARGKMIGRKAELDYLKEQWDKVRLGEQEYGRFILLSGEGGIGKTRLLRELEVYTSLRDGYVLKDTATEKDTNRPYALFTDALHHYIQQQDTAILQRQMPGQIAGEMVKFIPQLVDKLGFIPANPQLEPEAERARLLTQISNFVLGLAFERPTLLILDDLQNADSGSLDILTELLRESSGASLMIAAAYRDVGLRYASPINRFITLMEAHGLIQQLSLHRFTAEITKEVLEYLLGNTVSDPFVAAIHEATEGNPFFIEEVIKGLVVDGQIILKDGLWEQRDKTRLHVPVSVKAGIGSRLERIDRPTLEILQLAAAIGRTFNLDLLTQTSNSDEATIEKVVHEATQAQLIEPLSDRQWYCFQHAIIRETIYEDLRPLRRRRLHRRLASTMAALYGNQLDRAATLANHFVNGGLDEQAVPYLLQAAKSAEAVFANEEALDYFNQAQEILEDLAPELSGVGLKENLAQRFQILTDKRTILNMSGKRDREESALKSLKDVATLLEDSQRQVDAMSRQADFYWQTGHLSQARQIAQEGLELAQQNNDQAGTSRCLEQLARLLWTQRDPESMNYATQALALVQTMQNRQREAQLTTLIGQIYGDTLYDAAQAVRYLNQALQINREIDNRVDEAWTLWGLGKIDFFVANYESALQRYETARSLSESLGATVQVGWSLYHMGDVWYCLGDYVQALDCYQQAQQIFWDSHHHRGQIYVRISLGLVYLEQHPVVQDEADKAQHALEELETARQLAEERDDSNLILRSYEALSAYYRLSGGEDNLINAIRLSNRIIQLATQDNRTEHKLLGHYLRGAGFYGLGNLNEAYRSLQTAVELLDPLPYLQSAQISVTEIQYRYGRILAAMGRADESQTALHQAYDEVQRKASLLTNRTYRDMFLRQVLINRKVLNAIDNR